MNETPSQTVNETLPAFPFINFTIFISFSFEYSQLNQIYALKLSLKVFYSLLLRV